jgi:predicted NUDIX family NTP pyrophosphohydrolase
MPRTSAGLLVYRRRDETLEVFLVHPGGPFWQNKDAGAWSIPKGEYSPEEDPLEAAKREFHEETGFTVEGPFYELQPVKQRGGKIVHGWAVEGDFDARQVRSNTFAMEWPRGSGKFRQIPEVDRADWFTVDVAQEKILAGQAPLLTQLEQMIAERSV